MKTWRKGAKWAMVIACGMLLSRSSQATVVYDYVTDKTSYTGTVGQVLNVQVYLREALTGSSTSIITGDGGLLAGAVALTRSATGLPANPSTIIGTTFNATDFKGPTFKNVAVGAANFGEATDTSATVGVPLGNTGGGVAASVPNEIYLGTFQIMPGADTTTFTVGALPGGGNTLTNIGTDLDDTSSPAQYTGVGTRTMSFTVSVPEPTSLGFVLAVGILGLARRRRAAMAC